MKIDSRRPAPEAVSQIVEVLQRGGIVATRTDTVCGLLASVNRPDALERLTTMKVRPVGKPFVLLASDWISVRSVTSHLGPAARVLGQRYWPGPLTLVLPAAENLPDEVIAAGPTVAVRIPADPVLQAVLSELRAAIAAPSANLPGETPARCPADALDDFGDGIDLVVEDERAPGDLASTLVDCTIPIAEVLRNGPIVPEPKELGAH